ADHPGAPDALGDGVAGRPQSLRGPAGRAVLPEPEFRVAVQVPVQLLHARTDGAQAGRHDPGGRSGRWRLGHGAPWGDGGGRRAALLPRTGTRFPDRSLGAASREPRGRVRLRGSASEGPPPRVRLRGPASEGPPPRVRLSRGPGPGTAPV